MYASIHVPNHGFTKIHRPIVKDIHSSHMSPTFWGSHIYTISGCLRGVQISPYDADVNTSSTFRCISDDGHSFSYIRWTLGFNNTFSVVSSAGSNRHEFMLPAHVSGPFNLTCMGYSTSCNALSPTLLATAHGTVCPSRFPSWIELMLWHRFWNNCKQS